MHISYSYISCTQNILKRTATVLASLEPQQVPCHIYTATYLCIGRTSVAGVANVASVASVAGVLEHQLIGCATGGEPCGIVQAGEEGNVAATLLQ